MKNHHMKVCSDHWGLAESQTDCRKKLAKNAKASWTRGQISSSVWQSSWLIARPPFTTTWLKDELYDINVREAPFTLLLATVLDGYCSRYTQRYVHTLVIASLSPPGLWTLFSVCTDNRWNTLQPKKSTYGDLFLYFICASYIFMAGRTI